MEKKKCCHLNPSGCTDCTEYESLNFTQSISMEPKLEFNELTKRVYIIFGNNQHKGIDVTEQFDKFTLLKETPTIATDNTLTAGAAYEDKGEKLADAMKRFDEVMTARIELKAKINILLMLESACGRMKILHGSKWIEVDEMREILNIELKELEKLK